MSALSRAGAAVVTVTAAVVLCSCSAGDARPPAGAASHQDLQAAAAAPVPVPAALGRRGVLVVALDAPAAPLASVQDDRWAGLEPGYLQSLVRGSGLRLELVNAAPSTLLPGVLSGRFDVAVLRGETAAPAGTDLIGLTDDAGAALTHSGRATADVCTRRVAVERGTTWEARLRAARSSCASAGRTGAVVAVPDAAAVISAVDGGSADLGALDAPVAAAAAAASAGSLASAPLAQGAGLETLATRHGNGLAQMLVGLAARSGDPAWPGRPATLLLGR